MKTITAILLTLSALPTLAHKPDCFAIAEPVQYTKNEIVDLRLYETPVTRYRLVWTINGQTKRIGKYRTFEEAERAARKLNDQCRQPLPERHT